MKLVSRRSFLIVPPAAAAAATAWLARADEGIEVLDARPLHGARHASGAPVKGFRHAQLRGFMTLVHALTSWNPDCGAETALLHDLRSHKLVQLAGVFVRDSEADARAFIARNGNPYDALAFDADGRVDRLLGVDVPPNTFLFDSLGRIVHVVRGPLTRDHLEGVILPMVEELSPLSDLVAGVRTGLA